MAQPKKPDHLKQRKNIPVRMNDSQHERLMRQQVATNMPVAERALNCLMSQLEKWEASLTPPPTEGE